MADRVTVGEIGLQLKLNGVENLQKLCDSASKRAAKSIGTLKNRFVDLGNEIKKSFEKSSKTIDLKNKISETEKAIANLSKEIETIANKKIKSKAVEQIKSQIEKATAKTNKFDEQISNIKAAKINDLKGLGFKTHIEEAVEMQLKANKEYQRLCNLAARYDAQVQNLYASLKRAKTAESETSGKNTAEYSKKKQKLEELSNQLNAYKAKLGETQSKERNTSKQTLKSAQSLKSFSNILKTISEKIKKAFSSSIISALKRIAEGTSKANKQMGLLSKSLQRIKQALAGLLLYKVLQTGLKGLKDGLDNLAKASPAVNKNLSALMTSLNYLKNSLAAAFEPILKVVTPIITSFVDVLSNATQKVGQFFATLTGQENYIQAVKTQQDYAASLDNTTEATKNLEKATEGSLASFDKINILTKKSSSNNANKKSNTANFTTTPTIVSSFAQRIKHALNKQDFNGIGQLVSQKINTALSKINWSKIRSTAKKWASNIAGLLNGAVEKLDWFLTGTTIGNGIMTAVDFAYTFFTKFDFLKFGKGLAKSLNGIIQAIDWNKLGNTLGSIVQSIISTGFGFVTTFNWDEFGLSISNLINGFFAQINWAMVGQTISNGIIGAFSTISTALQNIDWEKIGKDVADFLTNIDWWGILEKAGNAIWDALTGLLSFFSGLSGKNKLVKTLGDLATNFKDFVGIAWDKLKKAYDDFLKPLAKWTIEKAVPKLIEALAGAFELLGKFIKKIPVSLLTGIAAAIGTVVAAFKAFKIAQEVKKHFDKIKKAFLDFKDVILKHPYATLIAGIASAVIGLISAMKTYSNEQWSNSSLKKEIDKTAELADKWSDLADEMSTEIEEINDTELTMKVDFENVDKMKERLKEIIEDGTIDESEEGEYKTIIDLLGKKVDGFETNWNNLTLEEVNGKIVIKDNIDEVNKKLDDLVTNWEITQAKLTFSDIYSNLQTDVAKQKIQIETEDKNNNIDEAKKDLIDYIYEKSSLSKKEAELLTNELMKQNGDFEKTNKSLSSKFRDGSLDAKEYKNLRFALNQNGHSFESVFGWNNFTGDVSDHIKETVDTISDLNKNQSKAKDTYDGLVDTMDKYKSALSTINGGSKNYNDYIKLSTEYGMSHDAVLSLLKDDGITTWKELESAAKKSSDETNNALDKTDGKWHESSKKQKLLAHNTADTVDECTVKAKSSVKSNLEEGVPKSISSMWQKIKGVFTSGDGFVKIKDAIWGVFKDAINKLISGINSLIRKPFDLLNDAFDNVRNFEFFGKKVFDWLPKIEAPQIPKLAKGAIVKAPTLAVVGDNAGANSGNPEVISPLNKLQSMINTSSGQDVVVLGQILDYLKRIYEMFIVFKNNGGNTYEFVANLNGSQLFNEVVRQNELSKKRHNGKSVLS